MAVEQKQKGIQMGISAAAINSKFFAVKKLLIPFIYLLAYVAVLLLLLHLSLSRRASFLGELRCTDPPSSTSNPVSNSSLTPESEKEGEIVKRRFMVVGTAAHVFVKMGAYRVGNNTFAVIGLASKPLHVYSDPWFLCVWRGGGKEVVVPGKKILPDWGLGRVYTVVVLNCTFPARSDVGTAGSGGRLLIRTASDPAADETVFLALNEAPNSVNFTEFDSPPKFDYLYCGSPLHGNLNPQRIREWIAYHARLFEEGGGPPSAHFVLHDAGGVHAAVMEVLRPWIQRGTVTLQDVRGQEKFDGHYHNQFLVLNDCLFRHRNAARWIFFFDVDEFLYVEPGSELRSVMESLKPYTQFTFSQVSMSPELCLASDAINVSRLWGFEKLVFKDVKEGIDRDRKYAIQPRGAYAAGVHWSDYVDGDTLFGTEQRIKYFHFHGTLNNGDLLCSNFIFNSTSVSVKGIPYAVDTTLRRLAHDLKRFEIETLGRVF